MSALHPLASNSPTLSSALDVPDRRSVTLDAAQSWIRSQREAFRARGAQADRDGVVPVESLQALHAQGLSLIHI